MPQPQILLPGLVPRPQIFVEKKSDSTETIKSTSGATFLFVKDCKNVNLDVSGKTGKVLIENTNGCKLDLYDRVLGGSVELIRCENMKIRLHKDAVIPIIQLDSCSNIEICLSGKNQIQGVYFQFAKFVSISVHGRSLDEDWTDHYDVNTPPEEKENVEPPQWVAHWENTEINAGLITELVQRDDIFPMIEQMKKVAEALANK